jgi:hypothetical protein
MWKKMKNKISSLKEWNGRIRRKINKERANEE